MSSGVFMRLGYTTCIQMTLNKCCFIISSQGWELSRKEKLIQILNIHCHDEVGELTR